MTDNRRLEPRKNAFRFGTLTVDGHPKQRECLVWDESDIGAMIELSTAEPVPDRFNLSVETDGSVRLCIVTRRDGRRLGVAFE